MKSILIVDDEQPFLLSLQEGLSDQAGYQIKTALNGQEALDILSSQPIDLLVTDLKMPIMDGFALLAHMSSLYPGTPVIVMTAFGTAEIEERLNKIENFFYLEKPLDLEVLAQTIQQALSGSERSFINGINLATFLQLIQLEKKTCTLKVKSKSEFGYLYIYKGALTAADTGDLSGEAAAYKIVCWQNPGIEMEAICHKKDREINASIEQILLEAFRLEDERKEADRAERQSQAETLPQEDGPTDSIAVQQLLQESSGIFYNKDTARKYASNNSRKILQAEQLSDFLQQSVAVIDFGIYVSDDLLFAKQSKQSLMLDLCPSNFFAASEDLARILGKTQLVYLSVRRGKGLRMLLFIMNEMQVVVALKPGIRCEEFLERISTLN